MIHNTSNSSLPDKFLTSIAIDTNDIKWIGSGMNTNAGLVAFDGNNRRVHTPSNSPLPEGRLNTIEIDDGGTKWIGVAQEDLYGGGLARF